MTSLFVVDWDDTCLCSYHLYSMGYTLDFVGPMDRKTTTLLLKLDQSVCLFLETLVSKGQSWIITNAEKGWIELSGKRYMPQTFTYIQQGFIKVMSARSSFEDVSEDPLTWKIMGMYHAIKTHQGPIHQIVGFGDSHHDRKALQKVGTSLPLFKNVKFAERPSINQLYMQCNLMTKCLDDIYHHEGPLDLMMDIRLNTPSEMTATTPTIKVK